MSARVKAVAKRELERALRAPRRATGQCPIPSNQVANDNGKTDDTDDRDGTDDGA